MTTPYGRQYLNMYFNQANPFAMTGMSSFGINGGYGCSSDYYVGSSLAQFGVGIASIFTQAAICRMFESKNTGGYYEVGGGGGGGVSIASGLQKDIDAQLKILNKHGNNYTIDTLPSTVEVEDIYRKAVDDAEKDIAKYETQSTEYQTELTTVGESLVTKKAELAKLKLEPNCETKVEYQRLAKEIEDLEKQEENLKNNVTEAKKAKREAELAKEKAEEAVETRKTEISNAIKELNSLKTELDKEKANPATLDAELDYSDGNWLKRMGKGENAQARQAIRDFRKAKQEYDAMPEGPNKEAEKAKLIELAKTAVYGDTQGNHPRNADKLDGSVKSGLGFIRNWLDAQQ